MHISSSGGFLTHCDRSSMVRAALRGGGSTRGLESARVESMADGKRDGGDRTEPPDNEAALSARLKRLGERLDHTSRPSETGTRQVTVTSAFGRGFRLSSEMVGGVLVGAGLGWLRDRWRGTSPWGLIVFLLLGFAAGILNVMRAAGVAPDRNLKD